MIAGYEYRELDVWLAGTRETARAFAAGIKHEIVPAGTESLQVELERLVVRAEEARRLVHVVRVNAGVALHEACSYCGESFPLPVELHHAEADCNAR